MTKQIYPRDKVTIDGGSTVYTVQAVGRANRDAYVTEGENTSIGTWVAVDSLSKVEDHS